MTRRTRRRLRIAVPRPSTPDQPVAEKVVVPPKRYPAFEEASARVASGAPASDDPLIAKLPFVRLRALTLAVLWMVLVVACGLGMAAKQQASADLLTTGVRVEGTVESVYRAKAKRGTTPKITVTFSTGSKPRKAAFFAGSGNDYVVGDKVPVFYARDNPERVRTHADPNDGDDLLLTLPIFLSVVGFPVCLFTAAAWRRRHRSVLGTGWRPATAAMRPGPIFPEIDVKFESGYKLFRARRSLRFAPRFKKFQNVPVLVGGKGSDTVLVFPQGRWFKGRLYAVPVEERRSDEL